MRYLPSFALGAIALSAALIEPLAPLHPQTRIRVVDGDTLVYNRERIRIWGLDCPEMNTSAGVRAKSYARTLIEGNRIIVTDRKGHDRYSRTVARVLVQRTSRAEFFTFDFACQMIHSGVCREFARYSHGYYAKCQP